MKKAHIVIVAILVLVVIVSGIVYQIFLKESLDKYREDHTRLKELVAKSVELDVLFNKTKPEAILEACEEHKPVWDDAIAERATLFDLSDVLDMDPIPEDKWPKFWYEEEYQKRLQQLNQLSFEKRVAIPNTTFGAPDPQQLTDYNVTKEQAEQWLQLLQLGTAGIRLLLDANVLQIDQAVLYPVHKEHEVLDTYTYGFVFYIYLADLTKFMHDLSLRDDKYYNVQAIRIRNGQLRSYDNPPLHVEMVLSRAVYDDLAQVMPMPVVSETGQPDIWVRVAGLADDDDEEEIDRRRVRKQPWYLRMWSFIGL
jgi:hypothetical protein